MNDTQFCKGLYVNPPHEKAPDFVKGSISLKATDLCQFLSENRDTLNKGYLNLDILEKKDGSGWYAKINDYKKPEQESQPQSAPVDDFDTPF